MDNFDLEIKTEFINESLTNLEQSEEAFLELETSDDTKPLLDRIFRLAHNLKGGSRAVGFGDVAEFTHHLENLVLKIQKGAVALNSDVISTLLRSNDRLIEMLNGLKGSFDARFDNKDILHEIEGWLSGVSTQAVEQPSDSTAESLVTDAPKNVAENVAEAQLDIPESPSQIPESPAVDIDQGPVVPDASAFFAEPKPAVAAPPPTTVQVSTEIAELPLAKESIAVAPSEPIQISRTEQKTETKSAGASLESESIRVSLQKIDVLNDLVGELIVIQSVVQSQAEQVASRKLAASVLQVAKLAKSIQEISMGLRMLPVKPLVQKLQRTVRDTAKALGKEIDLRVIGESMEVDKSVLDRLVDPLIHILRNGVDHGVESVDDRKASGKNPVGVISLSFENEGNYLVVVVKDDGKGIDSDVVKAKAIEKGLIHSSQALSDKQVLNLIFHPGFSTKAVTSEISGRGVGMDVVKTNVEQIGGSVELSTVRGSGSEFRIKIPLSLSVIDGMVVSSGAGRFVIPLSQVLESVNLKTFNMFEDQKGVMPSFDLRGQIVPLVNLDEALGMRRLPSAESQNTALIVLLDGRQVGIRVAEIVRSQQIVIKPLNGDLGVQKGWIGSCVLGDGLPTLIVNPSDLLSGKIRFGLDEKLNGGAA